ncbi:hypothetical protein MUO14_18010 [Halobacillus shinanisalinarum]|uniref:C4-dicarboxylate anaerobic carrier n=1 Tax=Halobacillus shinanisalinarum TaxID=2932258 RepID=A0ABY4GW50_9BACI|nr:hypothetical protein [Halobacillus shinanisalinarum]UOQ92348.1 hypothetical protein MUO14_18010 [Halobacillus shinanisalinarum]
MNALSERKSDSPEEGKETKLKGINPFVLMFIVIVTVTMLTYIVPAGQYERIETGNRTEVDPNSFEFVESTPVGLLDMFTSFHLGMIEGASIILFVFLFGGALGIMQATGAIDSLVKYVAARLGVKKSSLHMKRREPFAFGKGFYVRLPKILSSK